MSNHNEYENMQSRWKKARDAAAGEHEVHAARTEHLPKLKEEKEEDYTARILMTPWFGATWRTIIALRGMMFRHAPIVEVPTAMEPLLENIDNAGTTFVSFLQNLALEDLIVGRAGVLVDYPSVDDGLTVADAQLMETRPYFCFYAAEAILDWKYRTINGRRVVVMVRLLEDTEAHDEVEILKGEELHRILRLENGIYSSELVKVKSDRAEEVIDGSSQMPRMKGQPLDFIPFQPIAVDSLDFTVEVPPLQDLIDMNFHHYQQSSAYERGCFISGLPTLFLYGNQDERTIYIGGATANSFPDPQTKAEFVEVKSNFTALTTNLERKEYQMSVLGARMLEPKTKGVESGEALGRKQSGDESVLSDMATTLGEGITNPLKWMAQWLGLEFEDISVTMNKEFLPYHMDAQMVTAMMGAYIQKGLSFDTLYHNFNRAGMYPPEITKEDEQGMIEEGTPGMTDMDLEDKEEAKKADDIERQARIDAQETAASKVA